MSYWKPYKYVKDESHNPIYASVNKKFAATSFGPLLLTSLSGFFILTQIAIPLVSFKTQDTLSKPVESSILGLASGFREFKFDELKSSENVLGTTSTASPTEGDANLPEFYYLTVPKLGIERAKVETTPADLDPETALGHYIGSDYPGQSGNAFIYGHSVLPAFYNPSNYKTIFSTIHTLEIGDNFIIEYNNKDYTYKIESKKTLKPSEVNPLGGYKPEYSNESTVTLMTCSPPGTKIKRLLVNAVLVK